MNQYRRRLASALAALFASALLLMAPAWAGAAPPTLNQLFAKLQAAPTPEAAKPVEKTILSRFAQSGSASIDLLMEHAAKAAEAGDKDAAGLLLHTIITMAPKYAEGWRVRAAYLAANGDDAAALQALHKAVALNPRHFAALAELADLVEQYGDKDAALKLYRKVLALDPQMDGIQRKVDALSRTVEGQGI